MPEVPVYIVDLPGRFIAASHTVIKHGV